MKSRLYTLFLALFLTQGMTAQLTSLGLVEESDIAAAEMDGIKYLYMHYIPELSFVDDYLYVATPNGLYRCLYRTLSEWEKLPLTDEAVLDFEVRQDTVIALTRNQLLYSLDDGKTVNTIPRTDVMGESVWLLEGMAVHPNNAMQIYVTDGVKLMCTHNGGATWEEMINEKQIELTRLFYNPHDANQLVGFYNISAIDCVTMYYSQDGGEHWVSPEGNCVDGNIAEIHNVTFHPTIKERAAVCGIGVYGLSHDGGASWAGVFKPNGKCVVSITDVQFDMRNPDILYGAERDLRHKGTTTVLRSTDGGYTWDEFFSESVAPNAHVLSFDMKDNLLALYTYAGGIYLLDVDAVDTAVAPVMNGEGTAPYYDLMGRKVTQPTRGIYIKEGRKVVIE